MYYGDALTTDERGEGHVPVMGSNGPYDTFDRANLKAPCIIVGRKGSYGKLTWCPTEAWVADTAFGIDERHTRADLRWLYYALQTARLDEGSLDTGVPGLSREHAYAQRIAWVGDEAEQRAIADFLDTETARIDALIAKKQALRDTLVARAWSWLDEQVGEAVRVQLRRCLRSVHDGPFGSAFSSSDYTESGAGVVRLGNIGLGVFRYEPMARIDLGLYQRFRQHRVRAGNLLVAALGDENNHAGRACVAPKGIEPTIVKGKCLCAVVETTMADPDFLALVLSSPASASAVQADARGSGRQMINISVLKSIEVPDLPLDRQRAIAKDMRRQLDVTGSACRCIDRQSQLLREHRQALITAAVTGQMDVPGVVT